MCGYLPRGHVSYGDRVLERTDKNRKLKKAESIDIHMKPKSQKDYTVRIELGFGGDGSMPVSVRVLQEK